MTDVGRLGRADLGAIARLCTRAVADPPSSAELEGALFTEDQPAAVFGAPETGVIAVVECEDGAHIRLLAVEPAARRRGHGLFERRHYGRAETNYNMDVDLLDLPEDPGGHALAGPGDRGDVDTFMAANWPNWRPEVLRALDKGNLVLARDDDENGEPGAVSAFCAFEVNRRGFLGPVAVRLELMGQGRGKGVLIGALHELRRRGAAEISVVWVGPVVPYAAVGGRVGDVYFVYRKELA